MGESAYFGGDGSGEPGFSGDGPGPGPGAGAGAGAEWLPELDVDVPGRQRRWTVLLRLLLLVPHFIALWVLGIAAFFVAIAGWFTALVLGELPDWAATFLTGYVGWTTRVNASAFLLVDRYPPFALEAPDYPVRIELRPGPLNRLAVLLRLFLAIPAGIVTSVINSGWAVCAFFCWLVVLIMGRVPAPLFGSTTAILRYSMRLHAYWLMLTSAYPKRLFGDEAGYASPHAAQDESSYATEYSSRYARGAGRASVTRPLLVVGGARALLIIFIIVGVIDVATGSAADGAGHPAPAASTHR